MAQRTPSVGGVCIFPPYADPACTAGSAPRGVPSLQLEVRNATDRARPKPSRPGDTVLYRWGEATTVVRVLDHAQSVLERVQVRSPEVGQLCPRAKQNPLELRLGWFMYAIKRHLRRAWLVGCW